MRFAARLDFDQRGEQSAREVMLLFGGGDRRTEVVIAEETARAVQEVRGERVPFRREMERRQREYNAVSEVRDGEVQREERREHDRDEANLPTQASGIIDTDRGRGKKDAKISTPLDARAGPSAPIRGPCSKPRS